jgi:hypothetical protein
MSSIRELTARLFGKPIYSDFLNGLLGVPETDIAIMAAARILQDGLVLRRPYGDVGQAGKPDSASSGENKKRRSAIQL